MTARSLHRRGPLAIAIIAALLWNAIPPRADAAAAVDQNARMLAFLNAHPCAAHDRGTALLLAQESAATPSPQPAASVSPSAAPTPTFGPPPNGAATLYATPPSQGTQVTPPPIPTPTPTINPNAQPVYLVRGGPTPPAVTPAGSPRPSPTPEPTNAQTLAPGNIAVIADRYTGNTKVPGSPADAYGNVHVFYSMGEIVGDHAHYDGLRTITMTGHPYVIDRENDAVFSADEIVFDMYTQTWHLQKGRGESSQGVDRGLIYFSSPDLHTDPDGIGHGTKPYVTTCANARGGYHLTGKNLTYYPGDKIVITDAVLWLGAAAIFFLPRVVIPLRTVSNPAQRPSYFPQIGYDQYEGAYIKAKLGFGTDKYYYGYYRIEYYTKVGLGLGYVAFFAKKNGRRTASINYYGIHDRRVDASTHNLQMQEQENFSQALRGNFQFNYQGNYGPLTDVPPNTNVSAQIAHTGAHSSQNYSYTRTAVGSQSSSNTFNFNDTRQITPHLTQTETYSLSDSSSDYGGITSFNSTTHIQSLTNYTTPGANYQLTFDKTFAQQAYGGIDKLPELQITPTDFLKHFLFPVHATFTTGDYDQPASAAYPNMSTTRTDLAFVLGPALYQIFNSDFSATVNVNQFLYGTGDLKASIQQVMSLNTPITSHIVNSVSYDESNYNGPPLVPFQYLDEQPTMNSKNAQDLLRFFNGNVYNFTIGLSTLFDDFAQPVTYQLNLQPSPRSLVILGGSFQPGPGLGFQPTTVQFATPFGYETTLQFAGTLDWQEHARLENKNIYLTKTIGECYQVQVDYIEASRMLNVQVNLLAFPTRGATFGLGQQSPVVPSSLNF